MTSVERTAYPQFPKLMTTRELHVFYSPSAHDGEPPLELPGDGVQAGRLVHAAEIPAGPWVVVQRDNRPAFRTGLMIQLATVVDDGLPDANVPIVTARSLPDCRTRPEGEGQRQVEGAAWRADWSHRSQREHERPGASPVLMTGSYRRLSPRLGSRHAPYPSSISWSVAWPGGRGSRAAWGGVNVVPRGAAVL